MVFGADEGCAQACGLDRGQATGQADRGEKRRRGPWPSRRCFRSKSTALRHGCGRPAPDPNWAFSPGLADYRVGSRFSMRWRASARSSCRHCRGIPAATAGTPCSTAISIGSWRCARLLQKAGLDGADLAGGSVGGSFAAEVAAIWPGMVRRLALIAPWGLFDEKDPATDPWAQRAPDVPGLLCADPERWNQLKAAPEGADSPEWPIEQTRAAEAAARAFWPLGNTKLEKRLPLIQAPTLLIWGAEDRIMPKSYAERFAARDRRAQRNRDDTGRRPFGRARQAR